MGQNDIDMRAQTTPQADWSGLPKTVGQLGIDIRAQTTPRLRSRMVHDVGSVQDSVIARSQLLELGFSGSAVQRRIDAGLLWPVLKGVYAIGRRDLGERGWWMAGLLACGKGSALSSWSAASCWDIAESQSGTPHICTLDRSKRSHGCLVVHRPRYLSSEDLAIHRGLPVTSVARTLLDVASEASDARLRAYLDRAETLRIFDRAEFDDLLARAGGHRGRARLVRCMPTAEPQVTRSELERLFVELCRRFSIPLPEMNAVVGGYEVDAYWPSAGLVVELDGFEFHGSRRSFESDRRRDLALGALGIETMRLSYTMVVDGPTDVAEAIGATLRRPRRGSTTVGQLRSE